MQLTGPLERARLANQIQGFRIPHRWEAGEKNKRKYREGCELSIRYQDTVNQTGKGNNENGHLKDMA